MANNHSEKHTLAHTHSVHTLDGQQLAFNAKTLMDNHKDTGVAASNSAKHVFNGVPSRENVLA